MNDNLCATIVTEQDEHLGVVCAEWVFEPSSSSFDICVSRAGFIDGELVLAFSLPKAVDYGDFDKVSYIGVELLHDPVDVEEVVEHPCLLNQGIAECIFYRDGVMIIPSGIGWISDLDELKW